jgi:hypothetical protein
MPIIYGDAFKADKSRYASGTSHDAANRRYRNKVSLASEGGGTANTLLAAKVREGSCIDSVSLASDVNLSGLTFTVGTVASPAKYAAAQAGPAAGATVRFAIIPAMLAMEPLTALEEIILTPSGALPAAGLMVASVVASHR